MYVEFICSIYYKMPVKPIKNPQFYFICKCNAAFFATIVIYI